MPEVPWRGTAPGVHVAEIADQERHAAALGHDDVADIVGRPQQSDAADQVLLIALFDIAAAGVGIALLATR